MSQAIRGPAPASTEERRQQPSTISEFRWGVGIEGSAIPHLEIDQFAWTEHDARWQDDLRRIRDALGNVWLRYPLLWQRVQPSRGAWRWAETEQRLGFARSLGLRVVPDLVHFGTPRWLPQAFGDPDFPAALEEFAGRCTERLGDAMAACCPINEGLVTALFSGDLGLWPPFGRGWRSYTGVLSGIAEALVRATKAIRRARSGLEVWFIEAAEHHRSFEPALADDVERRNHRRFLLLDLVSGRVDAGHPLLGWLLENGFREYDLEWLRRNRQRPDRLGLDYYAHSETEIWLDQGLVRQRLPHAFRGFAALAGEYHRRYCWPLLLTETSAAGADEVRLQWLDRMTREVRTARQVGVPVEGFFWWPAFDHLDWDGAMLHRSGHVHPVGLWRLQRDSQGTLFPERTPLVSAFVTHAQQTAPGSTPTSTARQTRLADRTARRVQRGAPAIVVHSHLRWDFVWQRPQQVVSRLALRHPVLFIEEPVWMNEGEPTRLATRDEAGVVVAQPLLARSTGERRADVDAAVDALLRDALGAELSAFSSAIHWFYTPQMLPQLAQFQTPIAVVYDCMDELSHFAFAPAELAARERMLLALADVVFTGGRRLFEAKQRLHPNVHFFGCGVDFDHFRAAATVAAAADVAFIAGPRLGYVGVIDERLDYDLLRELARRRPEQSLVMVGPVVKVDPATLPRAGNIYWLGSREYADLPTYLAAFDVCLMPFALNAATEFINPTKTLEYLATGRPVVSTPVADVVRNFGEVVRVAEREHYDVAIDEVLRHHDPAPGLAVAAAASWESVVDGMAALVAKAAGAKGRRPR